MKKSIKSVLPKLSHDISSGTISDGLDLNSNGVLSKLTNNIKTRIVLNQTEGCFSNFKRKEFPDQAVNIYKDIKSAFQAQNKLILMQNVSYPLYTVFFLFLR